jgi:L-threonylcarbamoyladenylate synthase
MIRWRLDADDPDSGAIADAAHAIATGGVVAYPTDTLYGLGAHPWQERAVARVFEIKGRSAEQALPLIAADMSQVESVLGSLSPLAGALAAAFWPGPLTLVVPAPSSLPEIVRASGTTVAVRVPAHRVAVRLAERVGVPIISTSANASGEPPTDDPAVVVATLGDRLEGVVDAGRSPGGSPSTIVDVTGAVPRLVRDGAVPWDRVVQFLRDNGQDRRTTSDGIGACDSRRAGDRHDPA